MTTKYIQKEILDATELDGEWIILDANQFTVTRLNEIGGLCWELLKDAQTIETLTQSLLEKLSSWETAEQVKTDVEEFLLELERYGLVKHVD